MKTIHLKIYELQDVLCDDLKITESINSFSTIQKQSQELLGNLVKSLVAPIIYEFDVDTLDVDLKSYKKAHCSLYFPYGGGAYNEIFSLDKKQTITEEKLAANIINSLRNIDELASGNFRIDVKDLSKIYVQSKFHSKLNNELVQNQTIQKYKKI